VTPRDARRPDAPGHWPYIDPYGATTRPDDGKDPA
jgi:hypothetical protein